MNLTEKLAAAKDELAEVKAAVENGEKNADELEKSIEAVKSAQADVDAADEAEELIESLGTKNNTEANQEEKKMGMFEKFVAKAAEVDKNEKGWSVSMHIKAASDVVTAPQLADIDKSIAPQPNRVAAASFFSNATISNNAITYFRQGAYEGTPAVRAQSAKKPQNSTSFAPTTLPLSKIAAYIKETDEILWDADFLATEVQNSLVYHLGVVEDATVINTISGTSGILARTKGEDETLADAIIGAIMDELKSVMTSK